MTTNALRTHAIDDVFPTGSFVTNYILFLVLPQAIPVVLVAVVELVVCQMNVLELEPCFNSSVSRAKKEAQYIGFVTSFVTPQFFHFDRSPLSVYALPFVQRS